jgi:cell division protein FtsB
MKFLKKIGLKIQLFLLLAGGVLAAFLFLYFRGNFRLKKQMQYELDKVKKETELVELEKDTAEKLEKIETLKKREKHIEEKIKIIEEKEVKGEEIGLDELEDFFGDRGF